MVDKGFMSGSICATVELETNVTGLLMLYSFYMFYHYII